MTREKKKNIKRTTKILEDISRTRNGDRHEITKMGEKGKDKR